METIILHIPIRMVSVGGYSSNDVVFPYSIKKVVNLSLEVDYLMTSPLIHHQSVEPLAIVLVVYFSSFDSCIVNCYIYIPLILFSTYYANRKLIQNLTLEFRR